MKKYVFKPYNPRFPELFHKEKERILSALQQRCVIEHVGSTAVPNLGGKGVIDIAIGVLGEDKERIAETLQKLGYVFRDSSSVFEHLFFKAFLQDDQEGSRTYHVHLMKQDSPEWNEMISFRDYLRAHPKEAQEYSDLKKRASEAAKDKGDKYRELKAPLFKKVFKKMNKRS